MTAATVDDLAGIPAGPALSTALHAVALGEVPNDRMLAWVRAQHRQSNHEQARTAATLYELARTPGDAAPERVSRSDVPDEFAVHETRAALRWTHAAADAEHALAEFVVGHAPQVFDAWSAGVIDRARVRMFEQYLFGLDPEQIATICAAAVPQAPDLTTGQLGALLKRLVIGIDPDAAARWYRRRVRERGVCAYLGPDGTVTITAYGLPADEAQAACERVQGLAQAARRAGHPGRIGQIRADVHLGLLDGRFHALDTEQIIAILIADHRRASAEAETAEAEKRADQAKPARTGFWTLLARASGGSDRESEPGEREDLGGHPDDDGPDDDGPDDDGPDDDGPDDDGPDDDAPDDDGPDDDGPDDDGPDRGSGDSHDDETPDGDGTDDEGATTCGIPPTVVTDNVDPRPGPEGSAGGRSQCASATAAPVDQRRGIEIRIALSTMLDLDEHPGEIPGLGPVPAHVARARASLQARAEWRFAVTSTDGTRLLSEGRTSRRPIGSTRSGAPPGGIVELHLDDDLLGWLAADPTRAGAWAQVVIDIAAQHAEHDRHRTELDADPGARFPTVGQRRFTEIRDRTCTFAGVCRRPAHHSHQDHRLDHARGGATVVVNLGPVCPMDHLVKHRAGWITEPQSDGAVRWLSPLGGRYRSRAEFLTTPLVDPVPRLDLHTDPDGPFIELPETPILSRPPPTVRSCRSIPRPDADDPPPF